MSKWRTTTIGQLVDEGVIYPPVDGNHGEIHPKSSDFVKNGIPFVMASDIVGSVVDLTNCKFISESRAQSLRKGFAVEGDVLLTHKATIGRTAIVPKIDMPYIMLTPQVTYYRVKCREVLDNKFLKYYFDFKPFQETLALWSGAGSTRAYLGITGQHNLTLRLPKAVDVQKKISAILYALDAKIDCNNRINAELEAMAKTLYDYWFVQFEFPDVYGKPYKSFGGKMVYNAALKREIPFGWAATPLSSITSVSNDSLNPADFPDKEFKHFSIPVFDVTETYGLELGRSIGSSKFTVLGTDLLVSKLNPWFNRVAYAMDEADQICSTEFIVWRSPTENLKNFLFLTSTSQQFISHCVQSATGTSNSHKRVNPTVMMRFELPYEKKVAAEFGKVIDSTLKKIIFNQRENQYLAQLRDWLLPMLMNGQVTVA